MPHTTIDRRSRAGITCLILVLGTVGLAACGSSSSSTPPKTTANAATSGTSSTGATATGTSAGKTTQSPLTATTPAARAARLRKRGKGSKNLLPRFHAVLTRFAACLRQNGVNVGEPNSSGKGPIFDIKAINASSTQFKAAEAKCRSTLLSALRANRPRPGTAGKLKSAG
jgi:hypothetical protein